MRQNVFGEIFRCKIILLEVSKRIDGWSRQNHNCSEISSKANTITKQLREPWELLL